MQLPVRIVVSLVLLTSALATYHSSTKLRRDGVLNLYPFPRVGRASSNTWQVPLNEYSLELPVEKRQLYAFPRVGRDLQRARRFESTGMWFGPRLQSPPDHESPFKKGEDEYTPIERRQLYAFPRVGRDLQRARRFESTGMWFGPRLGRAFKREDGLDHGEQPLEESELRRSESSGPGMWFGPRVGRSFTSEEGDITTENEIDHSEPEQMEQVHEERKKRQAKLV